MNLISSRTCLLYMYLCIIRAHEPTYNLISRISMVRLSQFGLWIYYTSELSAWIVRKVEGYLNGYDVFNLDSGYVIAAK